MASLNVGNLGDYLREQRRNAQLSLRQLADAAGVSNPYLSQIERGLRKPSAEVLQQVAKALRISAETLYVRAGILDAERDRDEVETRAVILADPTLNERQKQVLLQIYESFRKENGFGISPEAGEAADAAEAMEAVASAEAVSSDGHPDGAADAQGSDTAVRRKPAARRTRTTRATRTTRTPRTPRTSDGNDADPENPNDPQQSAG
ncbi:MULTISPECIES: helix-turn-helix transcriptional regulator [unclassified Streptomyces]|uniref:helix-turn-helix domain-containing protein n=1 Tax=unclassified Streptomyces TaxID=2593676 RepID=UPI0023669FFE|nr:MULTISPECIES: helix-turn-helix transcriptional regulator [unclassified Streptomyces]MDF3141043.1 helix-turn-helix transcriptional regulator [Streptomyces sp. T21Q-yed]WDF39260.1 helix-turn-helix transcriptional regulator [Streptomyces sp. T12]